MPQTVAMGFAATRRCMAALCVLHLLLTAPAVLADPLQEYRLKAAFLYNFALFTEWPEDGNAALTVCVAGPDTFGGELAALNGKAVGLRRIRVTWADIDGPLAGCHLVFIPASANDAIPNVIAQLAGRPVLTVADSQGAAQRGVMLNMTVAQDKIVFEANTRAARSARIGLNSKLLRLATQVLN